MVSTLQMGQCSPRSSQRWDREASSCEQGRLSPGVTLQSWAKPLLPRALSGEDFRSCQTGQGLGADGSSEDRSWESCGVTEGSPVGRRCCFHPSVHPGCDWVPSTQPAHVHTWKTFPARNERRRRGGKRLGGQEEERKDQRGEGDRAEERGARTQRAQEGQGPA